MIKITPNIRKDCYNWWTASQKSSHGMQWSKYLPKELHDKLIGIGTDYKKAENLIMPFLEKRYKRERGGLSKYALELEQFLNGYENQIIKSLERITEKPIYKKAFVGYITTFVKGPYDTKKGEIGFIYRKSLNWQLTAFIHELLHMQFETYYKKSLDNLLTKKQFQYLKESMTIIINDEFKNLIIEPDEGYPAHQKLRKRLEKIWSERKNFQGFLDKAIKLAKNT